MRVMSKTARTVEAAHILVLLTFGLCVPFCFRAQPVWEGVPPRIDELAAPSPAVTCDLAPPAHPPAAPAQEKVACDPEEAGKLSVLPFLIALIGGGVFSLEAFEAFPML